MGVGAALKTTHRSSGESFCSQSPTRSRRGESLRRVSCGEGKPRGTSAKRRTRPGTVAAPSTSHGTPRTPQLVALTREPAKATGGVSPLPAFSLLQRVGTGEKWWGKRRVRALVFPKHTDQDSRLSKLLQSLLSVHGKPAEK